MKKKTFSINKQSWTNFLLIPILALSQLTTCRPLLPQKFRLVLSVWFTFESEKVNYNPNLVWFMHLLGLFLVNDLQTLPLNTTKNRKKNSWIKKTRFRTLRIYWDQKKLARWLNLNDHISKKTKNRKIDFSFVSQHCTLIWTKIWKLLFFLCVVN